MTTPDSDLPEEIESRLEPGSYDMDLTQRHVALEFVHGDRPFYNVAKMHAALGSSVSTDTVRARMEEMHERDLLHREKMNNGNIYWLRSNDSDWPIPPDVEVEPVRTEPTISEWRERDYVQWAAFSIVLALMGTAVTLIGTFEAGGYYDVPGSANDIIAAGLSVIILSYFGLFLAGLIWIFDVETLVFSDILP